MIANCISLAHDERILAYATSAAIKLMDLQTGKLIIPYLEKFVFFIIYQIPSDLVELPNTRLKAECLLK